MITGETMKGPILGIRHVQVALMFLCLTTFSIGIGNVAVAVVAMTNDEEIKHDFPVYSWNGKEKSYILSSFYWGFIWTQLLGGYLCGKIGAKIVLFVSLLGSGICSLIIPMCIPWGGWKIFCAIRVLQGLFLGPVFPSIHLNLAKWSPPQERNRLGSLVYMGLDCGNILAMAISGIIADGSHGWPGIYYASAGLTFVWCLMWIILGSNNPVEANCISEREQAYIESSMKHDKKFHKRKIPTPWRAIFTSLPFYALIIARMSGFWGSSTIQGQIPTYMSGVLHMDIKKSAILSALPYIASWIMSFVYLFAADIMMRMQSMNLTKLRKIINTVAFWIPAAAMVAVGYVGEHHATLAVLLMIINVGLHSGNIIGSSLNTIDLACNHAGILTGIVSTFSSIIPILTPLIVGVIVTDESERTQWQIIFGIAAGIFFFGNLIFILFGTADTQKWNDVDFCLVTDSEDGKLKAKCDASHKT